MLDTGTSVLPPNLFNLLDMYLTVDRLEEESAELWSQSHSLTWCSLNSHSLTRLDEGKLDTIIRSAIDMAEVLGIVTSVITITETAGKLGSSGLRLKRLWDEVQNVPDMIKLHMEQLQVLAPTLDDMDSEFQQTRSIAENDKAAKLSLDYCRRAFEALEKLIGDMELQIASARKGKRTMSKAKVALKRSVVEECEKRLLFALQLISISQQAYASALSRIRHSILMTEFEALRIGNDMKELSTTDCTEEDTDQGAMALTTSSKREKKAHQDQMLESSTPRLRRPFRASSGWLPGFSYETYKTSNGNTFMATMQVHQARFQLPLWLTGKVWDLQARRSYGGWKFQLTPWCTRSFNDDVFRYAHRGETEKLLEAFEANEASLYDCTSAGENLLDYAVEGLQTETVKVLVNLGLHLEHARVLKFSWYIPVVRDPNRVCNYYQYLLDQGQLDDDEMGILPNDILGILRQHWLASTVWSVPGVLELINKGRQAKLKLSDLNIAEWDYINFAGLMDVQASHGVSPDQFRMQLSFTDSVRSFTRTYWREAWFSKGKFAGLRALVRWMFCGASAEDLAQLHLSACETIHSAYVWFFEFGRVFLSVWDKHPQLVLQSWLEDLMEAGVDLEAYGRLQTTFEAELWEGQEYIVTLMSYGPRPEDWSFETSPGWEEYWIMCEERYPVLGSDSDENPPEAMPGGWVDSEVDVGCDEDDSGWDDDDDD
ncbi:hypothetical protein B0T10DRAFT_551826 [Thelonectria olida]|uniref:NACHT-NTPase and P-loop NTPases N-terminal domain-containing protein n=1 Tax=Thelonectria olida TaxID=1576542 RepID=A0A9P9AK26_9HYPO|nr:hypothetical protein B0T10DRAFT_551826 [Thelonectria olida]